MTDAQPTPITDSFKLLYGESIAEHDLAVIERLERALAQKDAELQSERTAREQADTIIRARIVELNEMTEKANTFNRLHKDAEQRLAVVEAQLAGVVDANMIANARQAVAAGLDRITASIPVSVILAIADPAAPKEPAPVAQEDAWEISGELREPEHG